jgi:hypothetical protein
MATWLGSRAAQGRADASKQPGAAGLAAHGPAGGMTCASAAETHHWAGFTGAGKRAAAGDPQAFSLSMRPPSGQGRGFGAHQGNA